MERRRILVLSALTLMLLNLIVFPSTLSALTNAGGVGSIFYVE